MKSNIGIDLDGVIFDTVDEMLDHIGLYYNEVFDKHQIKDGLEDLPGVEDHVVRDAIDLAVKNENSKIYKNAEEVINWLSETYNIYFISYRNPEFLPETINLLNKYFKDYRLYFVTRELGKHNLIHNKDIKVYIEDDAGTIKDVSERTSCKCLIFDQPWNQNVEENEKKKRVYNWKEVREFFEETGEL